MIKVLNQIKRIQALAEIGLEFAEIHYDKERYEEINDLSLELISTISDKPIESIRQTMMEHDAYKTPKVDVRGVVLNPKGQVLLIQEKVDEKWALPGGWADVSFSPKEIAVKEVWEESGIKSKAERLLAVYFNERHNPADLWSIYKFFIHCTIISGEPVKGPETMDAAYFDLDKLPPLSERRVTKAQILEVVGQIQNNNLQVIID